MLFKRASARCHSAHFSHALIAVLWLIVSTVAQVLHFSRSSSASSQRLPFSQALMVALRVITSASNNVAFIYFSSTKANSHCLLFSKAEIVEFIQIRFGYIVFRNKCSKIERACSHFVPFSQALKTVLQIITFGSSKCIFMYPRKNKLFSHWVHFPQDPTEALTVT